MLAAAAIIEKEQWDAVRLVDKSSLKVLSDNGMKVSEASPKLKKELNIIAKKMLDKYLSNANKQIKDIFKQYKR